jgi:hypothetical protein
LWGDTDSEDDKEFLKRGTNWTQRSDANKIKNVMTGWKNEKMKNEKMKKWKNEKMKKWKNVFFIMI